jgi:hypothetical protein
MNMIVDLSFPYRPESVTVKIIDKFLFIEALEFHGIKGIDCTKRFFKTCKKVDYANPTTLKAYYKRGKIRLNCESVKKRGETEITINVTNAKSKSAETFIEFKSRVTFEEFRESLKLMGMIL